MDYMEYRVYCSKEKREIDLCKFWINSNGDIDTSNLPGKREISRLLQSLRLYDVKVEFTGEVQSE